MAQDEGDRLELDMTGDRLRHRLQGRLVAPGDELVVPLAGRVWARGGYVFEGMAGRGPRLLLELGGGRDEGEPPEADLWLPWNARLRWPVPSLDSA